MDFIENFEDLLQIKKNGEYELKNDIDCGDKKIPSIISYFTGKIDGHGHTIRNLVIGTEVWGDEQTIALFSTMNHAEIKNIVFADISMEYTRGVYKPRIGALAGVCTDCKFENITFSVTNTSNDDTTLVYEVSNCEMKDIKIVCNGKENPVAKYN